MSEVNHIQTAERGLTAGVGAMVKAEVQVGHRGVVLNNIDALYRFSQAVAQSSLAPKDFVGKPESVMVAIQMGLEVGLTPMSALQNIAVINGRPSIWGDAQLAIVRGSGELAAFEECETNNAIEPVFRELCFEDKEETRKTLKIQIAKAQAAIDKNADDYGVSCFVKRKGFNEAFGRFTVADAKKAGLWGKQGPWSQYPSRMLKFRARSFLLRDQFGDALKGLLTREEASDFIDIEATQVPRAEPTPGPAPAKAPFRRGTAPSGDVQTDRARQDKQAVGETLRAAAELTPDRPNPTAAATAPAGSAAQSTQAATTSTAEGSAATAGAEKTQAPPASTERAKTKEPFVLPPAKTPSDWLPNLGADDPKGVTDSMREWLKFEEITDAELTKFAIGRGLAKEGQAWNDLALNKLTSILKARAAVRAEILENRA